MNELTQSNLLEAKVSISGNSFLCGSMSQEGGEWNRMGISIDWTMGRYGLSCRCIVQNAAREMDPSISLL